MSTGNNFIDDINHAWAACNFKIPFVILSARYVGIIPVYKYIIRRFYTSNVVIMVLLDDDNVLSFTQSQNKFNIRCSF